MILISPSGDRRKKLGPFAKYVPLSVPYGIGALAGYLHSRGKSATIIDEEVEIVTPDLLRNKIRQLEKPYIFGISCLTASIGRGMEIASMIRSDTILRDSKIVFGGIHPTVMPEETLQLGLADIVVRNEGEIILDKLYDKIKNGVSYHAVPGISYVDNGLTKHNPSGEVVDLDSLPSFPYDLFYQYSKKYSLGFITSSRGCPYECIFCSNRMIAGRFYRFRCPEVVVEEIYYLHRKRGYQYITFQDDNFLANKKRVKLLCELILKKFSPGLQFDCQARADNLDSELLALMRRTGFRLMHVGIECANDRLLKLVNKNESLDQITRGIGLLKDHGFQVSGTFILGLPSETREDRKAAYELANDLNLDYVRFNNATPYPGTKLYEMAQTAGRFNPGKNWENLNACGSLSESPFSPSRLSFVPDGVSETELRNDIIKFNLMFSLKPRRLFKLLSNRVGPAGWFELPERWFLKPEEWFNLVRLGVTIGVNFLLLLLRLTRSRIQSFFS